MPPDSAPAVVDDILHAIPPALHLPQFTPKIAQLSTQIPEPILAFSRSPFGTELGANIIAHCEETQILLDQHRVAWGTQYELSRGVISGAWDWADV